VFTLGDVVAGRQIRSTGSVALTTITGATTPAAGQTIDPSVSQLFTLTTSPSGSVTLPLTAPSALLLSNVNSVVRLVVTTTTAFQTTITFGSGFRQSANLLTGTTANKNFVITFVVLPFGAAAALVEISRTAAFD
jgi:hypothetical protein